MASDNARAWQVESPRWLVAVPRELLTVYHRVVGSQAVLLWLHLQCWGEQSSVSDIEALVSQLEEQTGFPPEDIYLALHKLEQYELVEMKDRVIRLYLPLSQEQFALRFAPELAAGSFASEPDAIDTSVSGNTSAPNTPEASDLEEGSSGDLDKQVFSSPEADFEAVLDLYHKRIGLMGPKQRDILQFWVEESGMTAEVVAAAIDVTARKAENPRIQYLEGVLRNWFNDGVRTYADAIRKYPDLTGESQSPAKSYEGLPNAGAYSEVDSELVRKWKELYPDEYNS
ncbi:MAG: DnaD domain protein [Firmicutes bacterium]|nr:DnaD domain protein [Bacillota bacterium]